MLKGWLVIKNISNYVSIAENCCVDWRSNKSGTSALLSVGILLIFSPTFSKICFIYFIEKCKVILSDNWPRGQASQSHTFEKKLPYCFSTCSFIKRYLQKTISIQKRLQHAGHVGTVAKKKPKASLPNRGKRSEKNTDIADEYWNTVL